MIRSSRRDRKDEESCFSESTLDDLVANALGVEDAYLGRYRRDDRGRPSRTSWGEGRRRSTRRSSRSSRRSARRSRRSRRRSITRCSRRRLAGARCRCRRRCSAFAAAAGAARSGGDGARHREQPMRLVLASRSCSRDAAARRRPIRARRCSAATAPSSTTATRRSPIPRATSSRRIAAPFQIGDGIFNRNWVPRRRRAQGNDGLGPTFNAISCSGCHANNGRGAPPRSRRRPVPRPAAAPERHRAPARTAGRSPDPSYGDQLQPYGILGVPGEGDAGGHLRRGAGQLRRRHALLAARADATRSRCPRSARSPPAS